MPRRADLQKIQNGLPGVRIGSYPFWRGHRAGCNIVIKARSPEHATEAARAVERMLGECGLEAVAGGIDVDDPEGTGSE